MEPCVHVLNLEISFDTLLCHMLSISVSAKTKDVHSKHQDFCLSLETQRKYSLP